MKCPDCGKLRYQGACDDVLPDLLAEAIQAFQRVAMAHPDSSEHSVDMHQTVTHIRLKLVRFLMQIAP
jgi:hypothetical protein